MEVPEFSQMVQNYPLVWVNFFAPWCFWSKKLSPDWLEVAERLHKRAYAQSVRFVQAIPLPPTLLTRTYVIVAHTSISKVNMVPLSSVTISNLPTTRKRCSMLPTPLSCVLPSVVLNISQVSSHSR